MAEMMDLAKNKVAMRVAEAAVALGATFGIAGQAEAQSQGVVTPQQMEHCMDMRARAQNQTQQALIQREAQQQAQRRRDAMVGGGMAIGTAALGAVASGRNSNGWAQAIGGAAVAIQQQEILKAQRNSENVPGNQPDPGAQEVYQQCMASYRAQNGSSQGVSGGQQVQQHGSSQQATTFTTPDGKSFLVVGDRAIPIEGGSRGR